MNTVAHTMNHVTLDKKFCVDDPIKLCQHRMLHHEYMFDAIEGKETDVEKRETTKHVVSFGHRVRP